ncbi:hypothetical protein GCM10027521_55150 [Amycolatopsis cihanbeyliensis]
MPETASALPATVVAAHLEACAAELAAGTAGRRPGPSVGSVADLAEVLRLLVAGQRHLSGALEHLAERVRDGDDSRPPEQDALAAVLRAAAEAAGYSADALAEGETPLGRLLRTDDEDTRL